MKDTVNYFGFNKNDRIVKRYIGEGRNSKGETNQDTASASTGVVMEDLFMHVNKYFKEHQHEIRDHWDTPEYRWGLRYFETNAPPRLEDCRMLAEKSGNMKEKGTKMTSSGIAQWTQESFTWIQNWVARNTSKESRLNWTKCLNDLLNDSKAVKHFHETQLDGDRLCRFYYKKIRIDKS
jgi:hypothetical protein